MVGIEFLFVDLKSKSPIAAIRREGRSWASTGRDICRRPCLVGPKLGIILDYGEHLLSVKNWDNSRNNFALSGFKFIG